MQTTPRTPGPSAGASYDALLQSQRAYFAGGATRPLGFRLEQLERLEKALLDHQTALLNALRTTLGKSATEAFTTEVAVLLEEIHFCRKNLKRWMRPRRVRTPLFLWPGSSWILSEPVGVALIIGPWNYPVQLVLGPLIAAIAAGCCAVIKPSELTPAVTEILDRLIAQTFPKQYVCLVTGGVEETSRLLEQRFDHVFFTGSTRVGRIVYQAAAKHLTPVTLELGGKSPAIVCADADISLAARRIAWGKFLNAGQTCVAPDYVYVHQSVRPRFLNELQKTIQGFFGADARNSESYGRIVNDQHFDRLAKLVDPAKVAMGAQQDRAARYFAPTVLQEVDWKDAVMQEEIFGPILPVLDFTDLDAVLSRLSALDKPLAAYFFSSSPAQQEKFLARYAFGGGCINDTVLHLSSARLPFGGAGSSGLGAYHGESGFQTFSHRKSVLKKSRFFDLAVRYPPYSDAKLAKIRRLFKLGRLYA